jgi:hypothetical protein
MLSVNNKYTVDISHMYCNCQDVGHNISYDVNKIYEISSPYVCPVCLS